MRKTVTTLICIVIVLFGLIALGAYFTGTFDKPNTIWTLLAAIDTMVIPGYLAVSMNIGTKTIVEFYGKMFRLKKKED